MAKFKYSPDDVRKATKYLKDLNKFKEFKEQYKGILYGYALVNFANKVYKEQKEIERLP